jgi:protease YdgD
MTLRVLLAATLALACASASGQQANYKSVPSVDTSPNWAAVGRLEGQGNLYCTATLIAPDIVLSAAHCVYDPQTGARVQPGQMIFKPGRTRSPTPGARRIVQIEVDDSFRFDEGLNADNVMSDVALLRLDTPLPREAVPPFKVHSGRMEHGNVSVVAYGDGQPEMIPKRRRCRVLEHYARLIALDCEVPEGSSGAPIFTHVGSSGRVLSVVSGKGHIQGRQVTFGMDLSNTVAELTARIRAVSPRPSGPVRVLRPGQEPDSSGPKFVRP